MTVSPYGVLAWWRHPAVAPYLRGRGLGNSEADASEMLVIDRRERRTYLAGTAESRRVVAAQWPAEEAVELTREQWDAVVERVRREVLDRPLPSMAELMRRLQQHSRLVGELVGWLDAWQAGRPG